MAGTHKIVAAIDFGTHGTGWAWMYADALSEDPTRRHIEYTVTHAGAPAPYPKNLSALLLDKDDNLVAHGFEARRRWRQASRKEREHLGYAYAFKMFLKADVDHGDVPRVEGALQLADLERAVRLGRTRDLVAAYLAEVRREALENIAKRTDDLVPTDEIGWCITVPAIWDEKDCKLMEAAAVAAGFPSVENGLLIVTEPAAAAVYCSVEEMHVPGDAQEAAPLDLGPRGGRFMIIDCGGGTVDITAFKVHTAADGSARLDEVGSPDGGKLGSEYVNRAFVEDLLVGRLGRDVVEKARTTCRDDLAELVDRWEHDKLTVHTKVVGDRPIVVDSLRLPIGGKLWGLIPEATQRRLADEYDDDYGLVVSEGEIQSLFDVAIDPLVEVIERQLTTMQKLDGVKADGELLVLAGGFSRSEYLQQRVKAHFKGRARVVVTKDPGLAVLLGAVHFCYQPSYIRSRRMKYSIGFSTNLAFREGIDPAGLRTVADDGVVYCSSRFVRMAGVGESIEVDAERHDEVYPLRRAQDSVIIEFFATTEECPPYIDGTNARLLGKVTVDMSESVGQPASDRMVDLYLRFGGAITRVRAVNRKTGGAVKAKLDIDYLR